MSRSAVAALALLSLALSLPTCTPAAEPSLSGGRSLLVRAQLAPTTVLFGDEVRASVTVLVDRLRIEPESVRLAPRYLPFVPTVSPRRERRDVGPLSTVTYSLRLRCLASECVPVGQGKLFRLPRGRIDYVARGVSPRRREAGFAWTPVYVLSRIGPTQIAVGKATSYSYHLTPLPPASLRARPAVLIGASVALAAILLALGGLLARRWLRARRPLASEETRAMPPLERALALLARAQEHGDETTRRKALERLASELGGSSSADGLARGARQLAWSQAPPQPAAIAALLERARGASGA